MGWPSEIVFITAPGHTFADVARQVADVLGYPRPQLEPGAVDAELPAGDGRPTAGLIDSSAGPDAYSLSLPAPTVEAAVRAAVAAYEALAAATAWGLEVEPEDGSPVRVRPEGGGEGAPAGKGR